MINENKLFEKCVKIKSMLIEKVQQTIITNIRSYIQSFVLNIPLNIHKYLRVKSKSQKT